MNGSLIVPRDKIVRSYLNNRVEHNPARQPMTFAEQFEDEYAALSPEIPSFTKQPCHVRLVSSKIRFVLIRVKRI